MVGNNTPVFFVRDPGKFSDFIHTQKRNPQTHLKDTDMYWDFLSLVPESLHQVTILFSNRGTPDGYRHMHGFSSHTFQFVDKDGNVTYFKWHVRTNQGIKNLTGEEGVRLAGANPDYAIQDLFEAIERGDHPSWTLYCQLMSEEQVANYRFDSFDVTKVWSKKEVPLHEVGQLVLNRNPENYFAEVEQVAFNPGNLVPGILPSADRMLQGRFFSYPDTQRHRLGPNFHQIPINRPIAPTNAYMSDGLMSVDGNGGSKPNYEPNSFGGPHQTNDKYVSYVPTRLEGTVGRHTYQLTDDDFIQPGNLYRLQSPHEKDELIKNIVGHLKYAKKFIQERQVQHFKRADPEYGRRVEEGLKAAAM
ncbi:catalase A [Dispira simplex]|nr:catalase A [Dispira simplex]